MPSFRYQALNAAGQPLAGEIQADGVRQAISQLEAGGLTVQSIGYASSEPPHSASGRAAGDAPQKEASPDASIEQAVLHSHMEKVLRQGKPLVPALRAYAEEMSSSRRRSQLRTVCSLLEQGDAAAATTALARLPEYWIPLLSSAASSNDPGRILQEFLEESQQADTLRRQWWHTLSYPLIVAAIAGAVLTALSFIVVPVFQAIFADFALQLPVLTRVVLAVASWITSGWAIVVILVLLGAAAFALNADRILPFFAIWPGDLFGALFGRSTAMAQFARFTADLLDAGIATPNALRIAAFTTRRSGLRRAGSRLANEIEAGQRNARQAHVLTATFLYALQSDMPTTSRVRVLKELSCCHADRARNRLSWTRGIIEPITICVVGVVVGAVVIALFLPLVTVISLLSG